MLAAKTLFLKKKQNIFRENRNFIYRIETLEYKEKYTAYQLNEIAKVLDYKIVDFFPMSYLEKDCIEEYHEIHAESYAE